MRLFLVILFAVTLPQAVGAQERITVATAANVRYAMGDIVAAFTKETGIAVEAVFSSSGKLTAQIMAGAPYDLFVSADMDYPAKLFAQGLTVAPPKPYAYGVLVLWSATGADLSNGVPSLASPEVRKVAIANPDNAPYGTAAVEALRATGGYEQVKKKLVYGESLSQVNQFVVSRAVAAGFTSKSVLLSPLMDGHTNWVEVPSSLHTPIEQGTAVTAFGEKHHKESSHKFLAFLFSKEGRAILQRYGYRLEEKP